MKGAGRTIAALVFLSIGGVLNVIYGIAGISNSNVFVSNAHFVFGDLKTWGWIILILGAIELIAAGSLAFGGAFGRYFAIGAGMLAALGALLSIPAYPLWSLAIFALSLWIIYGVSIYDLDGD
jgi:hypothetical protein